MKTRILGNTFLIRKSPGILKLDQKVYVFGGTDKKNRRVDSIEKFVINPDGSPSKF